MKKPKILFVSHSCTWEAYRRLPEELAKLGVDLTLLVPSNWFERSNKPANGYRLMEWHTIFAPHIYRFFFFPPVLLEILRINPDIIFLDEEPGSLVALQGLIWAKLTGAKLCFRSCENIYRFGRFPLNLIEKIVLKNSKHAVCMNPQVELVLKKKNFAGITKTIGLGLDKKDFFKKDSFVLRKKLGLNGFVIGFAGRLSEEKNVELLLRATAGLNFEYTLLIDNYFEGNYRQRLDAVAKELGVNKNIVYFDANFAEIADYINCMDVLVLPSKTTPRWMEQFGRVLIEAMACEVPVIGSNSGSIPWVIGDAGLIFDERSKKELAQKIDLIHSDKKLRKQLVEKGVKRVEGNFLNNILAKEFFDFFMQME